MGVRSDSDAPAIATPTRSIDETSALIMAIDATDVPRGKSDDAGRAGARSGDACGRSVGDRYARARSPECVAQRRSVGRGGGEPAVEGGGFDAVPGAESGGLRTQDRVVGAPREAIEPRVERRLRIAGLLEREREVGPAERVVGRR